jgi:hypothetical protein
MNFAGQTKYLLRKRSLVKTVFEEFKNLCQIEHTRYRLQALSKSVQTAEKYWL